MFEPSKARLRAPILRLQIMAAALLSAVAVMALLASSGHLSPNARQSQHASVPAQAAHDPLHRAVGPDEAPAHHQHL